MLVGLALACGCASLTAAAGAAHVDQAPGIPHPAAADSGSLPSSPQQAEPAGLHEQPAGEHAADHGEAHGDSLWSLVARLVNFGILAGTIVYLARSPFARHLVARAAAIRSDLAFAADSRAAAAAEITEIDRRMQALPGELEALRRRGGAEIAAERARIREAAEAERAALVEQARREIDLKMRIAEQALVRRTADLAVGLARRQIEATIGHDDQVRLLDRYLAQVGDAR